MTKKKQRAIVTKSVHVNPNVWQEMKIEAARKNLSIGGIIELIWNHFKKSQNIS